MNTAALTMNGLEVNEVSTNEILLICGTFDESGKPVSRIFKLTPDGLKEDKPPLPDSFNFTFSGDLLHHLAVITTAYQAGHAAGWKEGFETYKEED